MARGEEGGGLPVCASVCLCFHLWFSPLETESSILKKRNRKDQMHAQTPNKPNSGALFNFPGIFKCPDAAFMGLGMFDLFRVGPSSPTFFLGYSQRSRLRGGLGDKGDEKAGRLGWNPLPGRFPHFSARWQMLYRSRSWDLGASPGPAGAVR